MQTTTQYSTETSPYNIFLCIFIAEIKVTFVVIYMTFWFSGDSILHMDAAMDLQTFL
jgi:hypothetical protein